MTALRVVSVLALAQVFSVALPDQALAWEWFRSENDHVADGNELLTAGDHEGALREYDLAARELPSEPGVHLDRGLALLAAGEFGPAREAFEMASDPPASTEIRAMAHYNIGLSYYREADIASGNATAPPLAAAPSGPLGALGGILGGGGAPSPTPAPAEPDHARARGLFREAADAFRASLRQVPGNRDAGWNLELALRRITEEEEAEREEREREEEEESESGEEGEQAEESSGEEGEEGEPGEEGEESENGEGGEEGEESEENSGGEEGEEESAGNEGEEESEAGGEEEGEPGEDGAEDGEGENEESGREEEGDTSESSGGGGDPAGEENGEGSEVEAGGTTDRSLPPDMERVLDALETGEENLAAARARARGSAERRRVEQDW